MQEALKYISIMSIISYCKLSEKYGKYILGVMPLMLPNEISRQIYFNIYWLSNGDTTKVNDAISIFRKEVNESVKCMAQRLVMICKNDAFLNAFINIQVIAEILAMNIDEKVRQSFEKNKE